ncbi:MAG: hypothetical protein JWN44_6967 [Myxococcales bacterium]|nr:hypothetical protein [Myxococcales bacterium]
MPHEATVQTRDIPTANNKALRYFAAHTMDDALGQAAHELAAARRCACCSSALAHLRDRLGSTLFLDDDPALLAAAFPLHERDRFTPRLLAACILLYGRPRVRP